MDATEAGAPRQLQEAPSGDGSGRWRHGPGLGLGYRPEEGLQGLAGIVRLAADSLYLHGVDHRQVIAPGGIDSDDAVAPNSLSLAVTTLGLVAVGDVAQTGFADEVLLIRANLEIVPQAFDQGEMGVDIFESDRVLFA